MPETPEQLYHRAAGDLRMPPVDEWETFPFAGTIYPRSLVPPAESEPPRAGAGGSGCRSCAAPDGDYLWVDEVWRLIAPRTPGGLPAVVLLEPRAHYAEPGDLPDQVARELGAMLARVERAVRSIRDVGRVHVCRWGDGSEHLHWWFMARPARLPQLLGSFAAVWDDVLPPTPNDVWRENMGQIVSALAASPWPPMDGLTLA